MITKNAEYLSGFTDQYKYYLIIDLSKDLNLFNLQVTSGSQIFIYNPDLLRLHSLKKALLNHFIFLHDNIDNYDNFIILYIKRY